MRWFQFLSASCLLMLLGCASVQPMQQRFEYRQIHMGVETRIVLYAADSTHAVAAARAAFARIAELDAVMSDYRDDSELMRLTAAPGEWQPVSTALWRVLAAGQNLARQSGGAFDITAGPLVRLWREARRTGQLPPAAEVAAARERSGWTLLHLDSASRAVRLERPGMRLDLGGIAKGFAVDQALRVLRTAGAPRSLVEMGGDIAVGDPPPDRPGWEIRLEDPSGAPPVLVLANAAVSTSGDTYQYVEIGGTRYSHVIDPRTGIPVRGRTAATVIAERGLTSDPLSTLVGVLGPDEGGRFLREHHPGVTSYIRRLDTAP